MQKIMCTKQINATAAFRYSSCSVELLSPGVGRHKTYCHYYYYCCILNRMICVSIFYCASTLLACVVLPIVVVVACFCGCLCVCVSSWKCMHIQCANAVHTHIRTATITNHRSMRSGVFLFPRRPFCLFMCACVRFYYVYSDNLCTRFVFGFGFLPILTFPPRRFAGLLFAC